MRKYMSKSQRACDGCRARKSACRIETPSGPCRLCDMHARNCTFDGAPRNTRGVQRPVPQAPPSQHVAPLQTSTSFEQSNRDLVTSTNLSPSDGLFDMEDVQNMTGLVAEYSFPNDFVDTQESSWLDQAIVEMNAQAFNHSSASSNNASMDQPTNSSETTNIVCGLTGDMDPYLMQRYNFGPDHNFVFKRLAVRSMTQDIHPVQLLVSAAPDTTGADRLDGEKDPLRIQLEQLVSPDVGARLIALLYQFVYPHVPVFSPVQRPDPELSKPSLLAAIYMITLPFADFDDYLSVQIAYDLPDTSKLWQFALKAVHDEISRPDFATLQTLILLIVAPTPNTLVPEYATKWSLVGTILTTSQTLGLQFDPSRWNISPADVDLRKRLSWVVKSIDVWQAAVLGRSCLINDDDWMVLPPNLADFSYQEKQTTFPIQFVRTYELTSILHLVLSTLFSLKAVQLLAKDYDATLRKAQVLVEQIQRWFSAAAEIQPESDAEEIDMSGPMLLGGHVVKVLIFRAILRPFHNTKGAASDPREVEARRLSRAGAKACVAAFTSFTSGLKSGWIHAFWPFWCTLGWSMLCNLALLLFVTADSVEDAEECRLLLDRARRAVRLHSRSLDILRFSLLRIDSIFWKGLENVIRAKA